MVSGEKIIVHSQAYLMIAIETVNKLRLKQQLIKWIQNLQI